MVLVICLLEFRGKTSPFSLESTEPRSPCQRSWNRVGHSRLPWVCKWGHGNSPWIPARFAVNFTVGPGSASDIAFHFNPRFDGLDKVVFNSCQGGDWGKEEKKRSMPFSKGSPFELVFMVLAEHYKV